MSTITDDDVRHLAQLSSLQMSDEELQAIRADIENILNYVQQLNELDTTGIQPTYQVTGLQNIWRDDQIDGGSVSRERLLELAPDRTENCVKVPQVL